MKKLLTILIAIAAMTFSLCAQEKSVHYRGGVEIDGGATVLKTGGEPQWNYTSGLLVTTHGVEINRSLTIAAGVGLGASIVSNATDDDADSTTDVALTLFLHADYAFMKGSDFRPYIAGRAGMLGSAGAVGISCSLGAGVYAMDHFKLGFALSRFVATSDNLKGVIPYFTIGYRF